MDRCPPELHSLIFQLACTDDGSAYRSLVSLSKYFHGIARPFQYQSIAISGHDQIVQLISKIQTTPTHLRRVRHLLLSDRTLEKPAPTAKRGSGLEQTTILLLLKTCAPTLETLTFYGSSLSSSTSLIGCLFTVTFPKLLELAVIGYYPFPHLPDSMPRLKKLHLHGNRNPHGLLQMGSLDASCPELTHLRVSGLSMALSFVSEVEGALKEDAHVPSDLFPSKLPPNLRHLLLQPGPKPIFNGTCRAARAKEDSMVEGLGKLSRQERPIKGVHCRVLERSSSDMNWQIVEKQWRERLDGKEGYWES